MTALDRRAFLRTACAGCAALGVAACGGGSDPEPADDAAASPTTGTGAETAPATTTIVRLADIPVGGSVAARAPSGPKILLARPTETSVVAFSATCTHQQCTVEADGEKLSCPCHGSVFDAFTGKNVSGPAPTPLRAFAVKVVGADVVEA